VFGLGDKARGFDRRGHAFELWNTDAYGWKIDADPLYKSLPFWLCLRDGRAHGVFVDHPARAHADVGKRHALGHHQSRYGYKSEEEVRGVVARLQRDKIPTDAIWLDIDYQDGNAPFTVNAKAFPTRRRLRGH